MQHYMVLSFGQDVGSACWKVYENRLSRRTAPAHVHRACKFQCRKLPIKFGGRETNVLVWQKRIYIYICLPEEKIHRASSLYLKREKFIPRNILESLLDGLGSIH